MSPEKQRVAIAEACGWKFIPGKEPTYGGINKPWGWQRLPKLSMSHNPPDYLNDLNAMHEAEKVLTPEQSERYSEFILDVLQIPSPFIGTARCAFLTGHATAAQRAEAFLRAVGKREES